jgi:hypothetical protein
MIKTSVAPLLSWTLRTSSSSYLNTLAFNELLSYWEYYSVEYIRMHVGSWRLPNALCRPTKTSVAPLLIWTLHTLSSSYLFEHNRIQRWYKNWLYTYRTYRLQTDSCIEAWRVGSHWMLMSPAGSQCSMLMSPAGSHWIYLSVNYYGRAHARTVMNGWKHFKFVEHCRYKIQKTQLKLHK